MSLWVGGGGGKRKQHDCTRLSRLRETFSWKQTIILYTVGLTLEKQASLSSVCSGQTCSVFSDHRCELGEVSLAQLEVASRLREETLAVAVVQEPTVVHGLEALVLRDPPLYLFRPDTVLGFRSQLLSVVSTQQECLQRKSHASVFWCLRGFSVRDERGNAQWVCGGGLQDSLGQQWCGEGDPKKMDRRHRNVPPIRDAKTARRALLQPLLLHAV